jgi:hypothetical protein
MGTAVNRSVRCSQDLVEKHQVPVLDKKGGLWWPPKCCYSSLWGWEIQAGGRRAEQDTSRSQKMNASGKAASEGTMRPKLKAVIVAWRAPP